MPIKQFLSALATAGLLAGCSSDIDTLRNTPGTGSPFAKALTDEYRLLSAAEADDYDWPDAGYFARKGLSAASGQVVLPEEPGAWHLPADKVDEIDKARANLMRRLDGGFREATPEIAARAQARLDCWVEEQEENHRPDRLAACREGLLKALDQMWWIHGDPRPQTYVVYFEFGESDIGAAGQAVIDHVIAEIRAMGDPNVALTNLSVTGHADRSGSAAYNLKLSLRRADAVRTALIKAGVPAANIVTAGRGESDPAVPTPDGMPEAKNRRAIIMTP